MQYDYIYIDAAAGITLCEVRALYIIINFTRRTEELYGFYFLFYCDAKF